MKLFHLILFTSISFFANSQILSSDFLKGNEALVNGEYESAIQHFSKIIKKNKSFEQAYLLRSQSYYGLKEYSKAIKDSKKVLEINPEKVSDNDFKAYWNIGVSNNSLKNYKEALINFEKAKVIDSTDVRLYENSGYSYWGLGQVQQAKDQFEKMINLDPTSSKGYYGLGKSAYLNEEYDDAIGAFSKAIELDPNYVMAYRNRGSAYMEIGETEKGCLDWNKCLQLGLNQLSPYVNQYCK